MYMQQLQREQSTTTNKIVDAMGCIARWKELVIVFMTWCSMINDWMTSVLLFTRKINYKLELYVVNKTVALISVINVKNCSLCTNNCDMKHVKLQK